MLIAGEVTEQIIGLAIEVHRNTGRGLLESAYEQCLRQAAFGVSAIIAHPPEYSWCHASRAGSHRGEVSIRARLRLD